MLMKSELEVAYRATTYRVFLPQGAVGLRIGLADASFVRWVREEGIASWAILTASNPESRCLPEDENAERQAALEIALLERGFEPYVGENIAADEAWPPEQTCLVPEISLAEAVAFGQKFKQNAIIHGGSDGMPHLIWVDGES